MSDKIILFLDDSPERAAVMYQRMSDADKSRTIWVKTAKEAIDILKDYVGRLEFAFLDHDLGDTSAYSGSDNCGMEVVRFLESVNSKDYEFCKFIIHSWNIEASTRMTERLTLKGYSVVMRPFGT